MRRLVDEDLKIQLATKQQIIVSSDDIKAQMDATEQRNHMSRGGLVALLTSKGIETETIRQQIRADLRPGLRVTGFERRLTIAFSATLPHQLQNVAPRVMTIGGLPGVCYCPTEQKEPHDGQTSACQRSNISAGA